MTALRDSQRSRVYRSEWAWSRSLAEKYRSDLTPDQLIDQTNRVWQEQVTGRGVRYGPVQVRFNPRFRRGRAVAYPYQRSIRYAASGNAFWIVLHEVAHLMEPDSHHGWEWAACYLQLVEQYISKKAATDLRREFRLRRVSFRKTVKRTLSEKQLAALAKGQAALKARREAVGPSRLFLKVGGQAEPESGDTEFTGYLSTVQHQQGSGIAITRWREFRDSNHPGREITVFIDAGFGMRQLAQALPETKVFLTCCAITINSLGVMTSLEVLDDDRA